MEVLLKKAKITSSVLTQCGQALIKQLISYDILGFCVAKGQKWIVVYNKELSDLKKFPMYIAAEASNSFSEKEFTFIIRFKTSESPQSYRTDNEDERNQFVEKLNMVIGKVHEKGQFYI